ncbi:MAG: Host specificity protein, partial [Verrucomicrobiales bacterium]|nr:Host specificity protein [Verrucomicrobiales bacterium]
MKSSIRTQINLITGSRCLAHPFLQWVLISAALLLGVNSSQAQAQFGHINAGATSQDAGAQLIWVNGSIFGPDSGYKQPMPLSTSGVYAGFYNSSGPTMTALPTSVDNGGPAAFAALQGSFINAKLTLVSAPEGATFGFWDTGALSPSFTLAVGDSTGLIQLSDASLGAGNPGADPFGHIHGRRFSGNMLGDYVVGLQLFDTSDLGPGATPLHTPSDVLFMT